MSNIEERQWKVVANGKMLIGNGTYEVKTVDLHTDKYFIKHIAKKTWVDQRQFFLSVNYAFRRCGLKFNEQHLDQMRDAVRSRGDDIIHRVVRDNWEWYCRPDLIDEFCIHISDLKSTEEMLGEMGMETAQ